MEKIALLVKIDFKPEAKAAFLQAMAEHQQRCLATEPGTLQFEVMAPAEDADTVVLFELYKNPEALSAHEAGDSLAMFKQQAGPLMTNVSVQKCAVLNR